MEDMDEIYRLYAQAVYKYLLSLCRSDQLAEELTQETFYQAVKSIERFDGRCRISVWLCQIGKHLYYNYLRKEGREQPLPDAFDISGLSAEEALIGKEDRTGLLKSVHALPEPSREVVYLRCFGNLSFREIGEVTGRSENWARVTFYRAKERLRGEAEAENEK